MQTRKWTASYRVGQWVEVEVTTSDGCDREWVAGVVVRKTRTGVPVVQCGALTMAVDRKGAIRARKEGPTVAPPSGAGTRESRIDAVFRKAIEAGMTDADILAAVRHGLRDEPPSIVAVTLADAQKTIERMRERLRRERATQA